MPDQQPAKRKRTSRTRTAKPVRVEAMVAHQAFHLKTPIILAGVLVFAMAVAVALWTLAENTMPYADATIIHREGRVAGATTDFTSGPVTLKVNDATSPASFVFQLERPTTLYQMLISASSRMTMTVSWGVDAGQKTVLKKIGSLVATADERIIATVDGKTLELDDLLVAPVTIYFSATTQ